MLKYIGNHYDKILDICKIYSPNDYDNLIGIIIDIFIDKSPKIIDDEKFFYLISVIRNEVYNKKSKYNKMYNNHILQFDDVIYTIPDIEYDTNIEKIELILNKLNRLWKEKKITTEERNCFYFYYIPETKISIRKMNKKDVNKLRKISYRKLADKTKWNYQQIRFAVIKVENLIKDINKND